TPTLTVNPVAFANTGSYTCLIKDSCAPQGSLSLGPATLTLNDPGVVQGLVLTQINGGADLHMNWGIGANATGYTVFQDAAPNGGFATVTGSSPSGVSGLTVTMPAGNVFYLVAVTKSGGTGPQPGSIEPGSRRRGTLRARPRSVIPRRAGSPSLSVRPLPAGDAQVLLRRIPDVAPLDLPLLVDEDEGRRAAHTVRHVAAAQLVAGDDLGERRGPRHQELLHRVLVLVADRDDGNAARPAPGKQHGGRLL